MPRVVKAAAIERTRTTAQWLDSFTAQAIPEKPGRQPLMGVVHDPTYDCIAASDAVWMLILQEVDTGVDEPVVIAYRNLPEIGIRKGQAIPTVENAYPKYHAMLGGKVLGSIRLANTTPTAKGPGDRFYKLRLDVVLIYHVDAYRLDTMLQCVFELNHKRPPAYVVGKIMAGRTDKDRLLRIHCGNVTCLLACCDNTLMKQVPANRITPLVGV